VLAARQRDQAARAAYRRGERLYTKADKLEARAWARRGTRR
jgi:hypothetical protein